MIQAGKEVAVGFGILVAIVTVYYFYSKAKIPTPRFAAVDAIIEGVDRAVEMGKPVHYTGGDRQELTGVRAPMAVASFGGLAYTAALCAEKGARIIVTGPTTAEAMPIFQRIVYDQYRLKGKADKYDIRDIRFYGPGGYSAGCLDTFAAEGVACNIMIGGTSGDALVVQDAARRMGAMCIGGTGRWIMQYAFAVLADYMLIASEIYAAAAAMSGDERQIATIRSEDLIKVVIVALLIVGALLSLAGSDAVQSFLGGVPGKPI
jgi:hypothetical protein